MSENPVPTSKLCLGLTGKGQPCRNQREDGSDFCHRHQDHPLAAQRAAEAPPFPPLPSREALATPVGVRTFVYDILDYIAKNKGAELKRVYALRQFTDPLLRSVDMAALGEELAWSRGEVERLSGLSEELKRALEREREQARRRAAGLEEEIRRLRAVNAELDCKLSMDDCKLQIGEAGGEGPGADSGLAGAEPECKVKSEECKVQSEEAAGAVALQEELEVVLEEQHARREAAEIKLRAVLDRLRRIHRALCFGCAERVRPVIGGEPQPGDADFRGEPDRREYVGRSW